MPIPSVPDTQLLRQGLTQVGRMSKVYRFKFTTNWNIANPTKALTQFSSKDFKNLSNLTKALNDQKGMLDELKKIKQTANTVKETTKQASTLKKVQDALLKDVPGTGSDIQKAGKIGRLAKFVPGILAGLGVVLGVASLQLTKELSEQTVRQFETAGKEFDIQLRLIKKAFQNNKALDAKIQKVERDIKINNDSNSRIAKDFFSINQNTQRANKNANDALYEAREGRKVLEKKLNDNTYEIRQGRKIVEDKISKINADISKYLSTAGTNFQQRIEATVAETIAIAQTQIVSQSKVISNLQDTVKGIQSTVVAIPKAVDTKIADLKDFTIKLINGKTQPIEVTVKEQQKTIEDTKKYGVTTTYLDGVTKTLSETYQKSYEAQASKWNEEQRKLQGRVGDIEKITTSTSSTSTALQTAKEINQIKSDLGTTKSQLTKQQNDLETLKEKVQVQEKVNEEALPKLDATLLKLGLIPALVVKAIEPKIPTPEAINRAVQTGNCQSLKNGCGKQANDNLAQTINNNTNNASNDLANILGAANAGANAAQIGLLNTILSRIGAQVPGGLSGFLGRFSKWSVLNTAVNYLTLFATIHNAAMLSNDIGTTLGSALSNVAALIGFKDSEGNAYNFGQLFHSSIANLIKGAIGAENYTSLSETWAKANRIYQATTNVLNSFMNLSQTILQASELIASHTGKIGNALKKGGVILENAYGWMNPQPKFNRVTAFLEGFQNTASTIQMVTQAPLDVINATTELTTASTEFLKAVKEDDKTQNKATPIPEPDQLKAKESENKANSQPIGFDFSDLFDGED